ncbi:acetyltransferase [Microbacterium sp. Root61]|uniref:GNAT family N-acetyltransferase n=1 Tax=Microbacterium sp. Root61 TaxID=1736570 RepID=UPI000702378A|nr:GNAT family N-acetyltransferase [Microbacterium sp. Root61]KRA22176.1 acetyltransferase [Microbacterium sp. Root61]
MEPVTLRTTRLELSVPTTADVDAIYDACQDPDIQQYTTVPSPYAREHAEGFIEKVAAWWAEGAEATWAMRAEDGLAGMIGLHRVNEGGAEIGYWVAPHARGRGLLTEAAHAALDWGFSDDGLALQRIEWRAVVGNVASARSARAVGIRYEGLLRQALVSGRGRDDGWIGGLLRDDDRSPQPWPVLEG